MTLLSVNVNKIAVLRNSRGGVEPDVVRAARTCLDAGARGITVHPRPDARHIRVDDVRALAQLTGERGVEFNLEGNPFAPPRAGYPGFIALCEQVRPAQATLVPDSDAQLTSDHGFDFARDGDALRPLIARLKRLGCRVSVFVDAAPVVGDRAAADGDQAGGPPDGQTDSHEDGLGDRHDPARAAALGADRVELYTGPYAAADPGGRAAVLERFAHVARRAQAAGLGINAGHDLDQTNLAAFLAAVPDVLEVSIGHALISEALYDGLAETVRRYLAVLGR